MNLEAATIKLPPEIEKSILAFHKDAAIIREKIQSDNASDDDLKTAEDKIKHYLNEMLTRFLLPSTVLPFSKADIVTGLNFNDKESISICHAALLDNIVNTMSSIAIEQILENS